LIAEVDRLDDLDTAAQDSAHSIGQAQGMSVAEIEEGPLFEDVRRLAERYDELYDRVMATGPATIAGAIAMFELSGIGLGAFDAEMGQAALDGLRRLAEGGVA